MLQQEQSKREREEESKQMSETVYSFFIVCLWAVCSFYSFDSDVGDQKMQCHVP